MTWLAAGDCNTKFFHNHAQQRRRTNNMAGILNDHNEWSTSDQQMESVAVDYFERLFASS